MLNILFLTHRLPYAPNRGDRIRAYYLLREMARFARVSLFSLVHDDEEAARAADVPFAIETRRARVRRARNAVHAIGALATGRPLTHALLHASDAATAIRALADANPPDVVVAFCTGIAPLAMTPPLERVPLVLDMVDVDSGKWARMADAAAGWRRAVYAREARTLRAFEGHAVRIARTTLVVNDREAYRLERDYPDADIEIVQNGIDVDAFRPSTPPASTPTVVFTGVMNYQPNVDAVTWFASRIWPAVRARRPDATFAIVGASPSPDVVALAERDPSIDVTGAVPAVQPALWSSALAVAPVRLAQGVQNKVLEAVAAGLPAVVTQAVWDGLPEDVRPACALAADERTFADEVVALLNMTPDARRARAGRASLDELGWRTRLARLEPLLRSAVNAEPARR